MPSRIDDMAVSMPFLGPRPSWKSVILFARNDAMVWDALASLYLRNQIKIESKVASTGLNQHKSRLCSTTDSVSYIVTVKLDSTSAIDIGRP